MPSTQPDLTPVYHLPSPVPADPPDVPGDMKALTGRLEQVLLGVDKVFHFLGEATTNANGDAGFVFSTPLPFTPDGAIVQDCALTDPPSHGPITYKVTLAHLSVNRVTFRAFGFNKQTGDVIPLPNWTCRVSVAVFKATRTVTPDPNPSA